MSVRTPLAAAVAVAALLAGAPAAMAATQVVDDDRAQCPNAAFTTIQAAIDAAAANDDIAICAGTYREANGVLVDKPLSVRGAGAARVRIEPAADMRDPAPPGGIYVIEDGAGNVITVNSPGGPVDISGVTVAGGNPSDPRGAEAGVVFANTSGSFTRSRVTDVVPEDTADFSANVGYGVVAFADQAGSRTFSMSRTLVERYAKGGVLLRSFAADATVTGAVADSVIRGRGPRSEPGQGQNGIQLRGQGASASIERNSIVDHRFLPDESASVGVLLFDANATDTAITANDFRGNGYGVFNAGSDLCDASVPVAAPSNWWGDPAGPTVDTTSGPLVCPPAVYAPVGDPALGDRVNGTAVEFAPHATEPHGAPTAPGDAPDAAPTVAVTAPKDGATVPTDANIAITATARDDFDVSRVDFVRSGTVVASDASGPEYSADVAPPATGQSVALTAVAYDSAGQSTSDSVAVAGADPPPTVSITSPADGTTVAPGEPFPVEASASDDTDTVRFQRGSQIVDDSTAPYEASLTGPSAGQSQTVIVVAFDAGGQTATDAISVTGRQAPVPQAPRAPVVADDRPPAVSFTSPAPGAAIDPRFAPPLRATASDDRGVARVAFLDDGKVVCIDAAFPYECRYVPTGDDVGRNTLIAIAQDGAGQTAVDFRAVTVGKFTPTMTARTTPRRDRRRPYRYRTSGRIVPPAGLSAAEACGKGGSVQVQFAAGRLKLPISAALNADCTFKTSIAFPSRRPLGRRGRLTVTTYFAGNEVLGPAQGRKQRVRAG